MLYGKMYAGLPAPLKKSTIALTLATVLCATSCKTQKTASVQTNSLTQYDSTQTVTTDSAGESLATGLTVSNEDIEQTTETVEWSEPDTAGRQHPVRTTRTVTNARRNSQSCTTNTNSTVRTSTAHSSTTGQTIEQTAEQTESKTRTMRNLWLVWLIVGVAVAMAVKRTLKN